MDEEPVDGVFFAQVDSSGQLLRHRFLTDSMGDVLRNSETWGKVIFDSISNCYVATGATVFRPSSFLFKLNDTLGLEHVQEYADTVNLSNYKYTVTLAHPDGYYLHGRIQGPDTVSFGFVRRIDMYGEEIWERRFEHSLYSTTVMDVQILL